MFVYLAKNIFSLLHNRFSISLVHFRNSLLISIPLPRAAEDPSSHPTSISASHPFEILPPSNSTPYSRLHLDTPPQNRVPGVCLQIRCTYTFAAVHLQHAHCDRLATADDRACMQKEHQAISMPSHRSLAVWCRASHRNRSL